MPHKVSWLLIALSVLAADSGFADPPIVHDVPETTSPIDLNGSLDDEAWKTAARVELPYEVQPGENIPPPVKTVCYITYDRKRIYFGFRADDPDPSRIRARYSDRDRAWSDDWVGIVLDTFNDQRRAYELFSTPLGVQIDAINDDVGGNYDDSWNAIWESAGRITESGYEVEMAVPFNQIRFQKVDGEQVWGFDALRSYPRTDRHHIGAFPRDRNQNSYLSQAIKIRGMSGVSPGKNLEVIPTVTGNRTDTRTDLGDEDLVEGDPEFDVGVSARWGMTPNMSLNGALNPDFSQVEADALQLDVNEQFALFFQETRPFFLEGADYFNTGLNLVHTRTVVDPAAAGKLTGKQGPHTWGVFTARDDVTHIVVPGPDGSQGAQFDIKNVSSAGRYRMDFGPSSTVGAMITDRRGEGYANSVVSADAVYRITKRDRIITNVALSRTEYNAEMMDELGVPSGSVSDEAATFNFTHSERGWWVEGDFAHFGENYRSDMGFRPRVGYHGAWIGGAKVWWGGQEDFFNRRAWGGGISRANRESGSLIEKEIETWANASGPLQSYIYGNASLGTRRFQDIDFDVWRVNCGFEVQATGDLYVSGEAHFGEWIDFANVQPAHRLFLKPSASYTLGRHLKLNVNHTVLALHVDGGRLFTVHAPDLRFIHQFNARAFLRVVLQYTRITRDPSLYSDTVDRTEESLLSQLLFSYKVNPQTALYLGYGDNRFGDDQYDLTQAHRTFFMKLGYAWVK